ncbi:MAG: hypothetical protein C4576_00895 [Desulfobacteraceae bacterium]|nr:MAG: hypothetical protein C4576_00895 [Desulfobacteraceae bacterium]
MQYPCIFSFGILSFFLWKLDILHWTLDIPSRLLPFVTHAKIAKELIIFLKNVPVKGVAVGSM